LVSSESNSNQSDYALSPATIREKKKKMLFTIAAASGVTGAISERHHHKSI
jgi:hypothetical protein